MEDQFPPLLSTEDRIARLEKQIAPMLELFSELHSAMNAVQGSWQPVLLGGSKTDDVRISSQALQMLSNFYLRLRAFMEHDSKTLPGHYAEAGRARSRMTRENP
jgi:hypothetical protein